MTGPRLVVAAAIVRDGRLLVAQRSYPPEYDGRWELPGGKVKPGESEPVALRRECREELGVSVSVGRRVGRDVATADETAVLRVYSCALVHGEPVAIEHRALRWLAPEGLAALDWLESDRALIPVLSDHLRQVADETEPVINNRDP